MTNTEKILTQIRDLIAHRGPHDRRGMPTLNNGVETPLIMAEITAEPADMVGRGPGWWGYTFQDTHHYTGGELLVVVESRTPPAALNYFAEVRLTGWVGAVADTLAVAAVNSATGPLVVPWVGGTAFDKITVEARQVINGVPSGAVLAGAALRISLQGRLYR